MSILEELWHDEGVDSYEIRSATLDDGNLELCHVVVDVGCCTNWDDLYVWMLLDPLLDVLGDDLDTRWDGRGHGL